MRILRTGYMITFPFDEAFRTFVYYEGQPERNITSDDNELYVKLYTCLFSDIIVSYIKSILVV